MQVPIRIGTRESQLAMWQALQVKELLARQQIDSHLVLIKSGGDIDQNTPLYEMGVQGIFTKELDIALLEKKIDLAVHSYKDVPTQLAAGIQLAAVLKRGAHQDVLVFKDQYSSDLYHALDTHSNGFTIATSSIRRRAQWLHQFPKHRIDNLRGNINTRLKKLSEAPWNAAVFAKAGLERIDLLPPGSLVLDWMLPAPAQGAIVVVCRQHDTEAAAACTMLNDTITQLCTHIERDFLRALLGGCSTPISALAEVMDKELYFQGNILSTDGSLKETISIKVPVDQSANVGSIAAKKILQQGGQAIADQINNATK